MLTYVFSLMNEDMDKISRRVCWDLLQRLLGSAAGVSPGAYSRSHSPVSRTQEISSVERPEDEVNGLVESDDDLPPLGGEEESGKENGLTPTTRALRTLNESINPSPKQVSPSQSTRENSTVLARRITRPSPCAVEEEPFKTFRLVRVSVKNHFVGLEFTS